MTDRQKDIFAGVIEMNNRLEIFQSNDYNLVVNYETDGFIDYIKLGQIILWDSEDGLPFPEGSNWADFISTLILEFSTKLHLIANTIKYDT